MNGKKIGALATAAAILLTGCGSNGDGSADDKSSDCLLYTSDAADE